MTAVKMIVKVWGTAVEIDIDQRSKAVCVATGSYNGKRHEVKRTNATAAAAAWVNAAKVYSDPPRRPMLETTDGKKQRASVSILCDKCGGVTRVMRTARQGAVVIRKRQCVRCHHDMLTRERRVPGSSS
jgi:hypothetical protein